MNCLLTSRPLRTAVAWLVTLSLALAGGGCATTGPSSSSSQPLPPGAYAVLEAVVIDAQRLARPDELAQVRVLRNNVPVPTRPRMPLQTGDLVQTGANAYAVLHYARAEVLMRPGSQGRVGSLTDVIGEVFAKIRGVFAVETSFVRAGADGTAYLVRGASDGSAVVTVFDGTVTLTSRLGAWAPQRLPVGETAFCPPRSGAPQARPASAQELEQTRAWVERIERVVAPRPSYGTVAAVAAIAVLVGAILSSRGGGRSGSSSTSPAGTPSSPGTPSTGRPGTITPERPPAGTGPVIR